VTDLRADGHAKGNPFVWLGQSVDTSSLCSRFDELRRAPFLTSLGCAIRRPSLGRTHFHSGLRATLGVSGPLMLDSGGFALSTKPTSTWTVDFVGDFIEKIDADIFVTLDFPPGLRDPASERRKKICLSLRNYEILRRRCLNKTIMPVVHGRNISEIELSVRLLRRYAPTLKWVGLGGMVPLFQHRNACGLTTSPEVFIAEALGLLREAFPTSKIHVFGAGGTRTFPAVYALGADSGDSIGWRQAAGYGSVFLPMKSQRAVKWNNEKRPPRKLLDASDMFQLENCRCPFCCSETIEKRLEGLRRHFYSRSIHNAWTILNQWRYWPRSRGDLINAISEGILGPNWAKAASLRQ
jgi:queuine/archaeosine tRNA-ribosyltransferase